MATVEVSVSMRTSSANVEANSDAEDDSVVRRKNKMYIILSDDEEGEDTKIGPTEVETRTKVVSGSKEIIDSKGCREKNKAMDYRGKEIDLLLANGSDSVKEFMNPSPTVEMTILKNPTVGDDSKSESIDNISKNIGENEAESKGDSIASYSPRTLLSADAETSKEEPYRNPKRFTNILDSDSEDERTFSPLFNKKISPSYDESGDSRSVSPGSDCLTKKQGRQKAGPVHKLARIINSDSEDEERIVIPRKRLVPKESGDIETSLKSTKPNKISTLIDTDSEGDVQVMHKFGGSSDEGQPMITPDTMRQKKKTGKKKQTGSIRAAKEAAMREIHSESQRMLRESQVCLPYHRPKQRTLQDFLNRRKDLPTLPKTLTTAAKMKMSGEIVGKVLEEKEKEAELFYKSSSDSDTEGGTQTGLTIADIKSKAENVEDKMENIPAIEETQKVIGSDLINRLDIKEVIQQGDKSLGLPRKLFNRSVNEAETTEAEATIAPSPITEDDSNESIKENQDCNQRRKEFKRGLKDVSIPRKLFGSKCVEPMDTKNTDKVDDIQDISEMNNSQANALNKSDQFLENEVIGMLVKNSEAQENESMEEKADDFELKMSEDSYELINDQIACHDTATLKTSTIEFEPLTETPVINSWEVSKLNETEKTDSGTIVVDENLINDYNTKARDIHFSSKRSGQLISTNKESSCNVEDSKDLNEPIGHVYGLPLPEFEDDKPKKKTTRILPDIMRLTPKLRGSPDMMIELTSPKVGVSQLIKRFVDHSIAKKIPQSNQEIIAMHTEQMASGLGVINEVLPYRIPRNEKNDDPDLSKPGAKLIRLKEDLQQQMAMQRTKEWKQKELEIKKLEDDDVYRDERSDCGMVEENDLDEEEEEELSDGGESEPDEDDMPIKEAKHKYKSPFVNAEAEVSGEESEDEEGAEGSVADEEDAGSDHSSDDDNEDEENEESETDTTQKNKTSKFKRIAKAFEDDDFDDAEVDETDANTSSAKEGSHFRRTKTDVDMFAMDNKSDGDWSSGTEDDLPVYQQRIDERSQLCTTPSVANNMLSIVSPITQLTALNTGSGSINTDLRTAQNPLQLIAPLSVETTPIELKCYRECDSEKREKLQKKLFDDVKETPSNTESMGFYYGQFSENPSKIRELDRLVHPAKNTEVTDAELLELCSGTFDTQPSDIKKLDACVEKVPGAVVPSSNNSFPSTDKSSKEQLQGVDTIPSTYKIVFSSDDEEERHSSEIKDARGKKLKKKVRKLKLSDDEKESDDAYLSDSDEKENEEEEFIDYDSDENEIVVSKRDIRKDAARFLDEEAELSESEWGSADEDERNLDKLDWEEGDLEDIDQDQVKKQLEKLHMRQVLDEDQREVRLLQEILLEDGELHSDKGSRQRKFKWKNIDELGEDNGNHLQSVDDEGVAVDQNEEESELEWRKKRLEREQFLKEQRKKEVSAEDDEEMEDSQLFKLGLKALKKNKTIKNANKDGSNSTVLDQSETVVTRHTVADLFASSGSGKRTFALQNAIHRGSFLARGEESLARLSVITRQNNDQAIIRTKKSRNFVFAHLSPAIETPVERDELDDQANTETMDAKLRKRKPVASLTPVASKRLKKDYQQRTDTRNKLFH